MKPDINLENYGTTIENPVLLSSIRAGYNYCDKLCKIDEDLEYSRRCSNVVAQFDKPVDTYIFKRFGKEFCTVFIYAYHSENIEEVPEAFFSPDEENDLLEDIFEQLEIIEEEGGDPDELLNALYLDEQEDPPSREELLTFLLENILTKNDSLPNAGTIDWTTEDQDRLNAQLDELRLSPLFEKVVLQEWEDYLERTHRPHREFFIHSFIPFYQ